MFLKERESLMYLISMMILLKSLASADIDGKDENAENVDEKEIKLYEAAENGDLETVRLLCKAGVNLNKTHDHGYTPLHIAAIKGYGNILKLIISYPIDLEIRDSSGRTALQEAVLSGQKDSVQILIDAKANVNITDFNKQSLLHLAAPFAKTDLLKVLIKYCNLEGRDNFNRTSLFRAAEKGNMEALNFLLKNGADPLTIGHLDNNLLHIAAENGHALVIKELSKFKELLNAKNQLEDTPLFSALDNNQTETVYELINAGALIEREFIWKALVEDDYDIVKFMINRTGEVNVRHPRVSKDCGNTLLMDAVSLARLQPEESLSLVKFLLDKGADVSLKNCEGSTALHFAASLTLNKKILELLISKGADLNVEDSEGFTPVDLACGRSVEFLRNLGAKFGDEI